MASIAFQHAYVHYLTTFPTLASLGTAAATWLAELAAVTPDAFDSTLALSMSLTDGNASGIANFSALLKVRALHAVRALRDPDYTDPYTLAVPAQAPSGVRIGFVVSF